ncbi:MAG: iron-sulfur cluster assembly scaffold protein [Desulfobacteraceae bacterium]|nr:MAG: iron-sulfur cluster assembly scaffold protein [Desulfobacteraceae bacterium]
MSDTFDDFIKGLQNNIMDDTRAVYGEIVYQRWLKPLYAGALRNADGYGRIKGSCGDTMEMFLKFKNDKVKEASFQTDGCGPSMVCGSYAAEMSFGKTPDELLEITGEKVLEVLGGLPEKDRHCAYLAVNTLQEALNDYMKKQREINI